MKNSILIIVVCILTISNINNWVKLNSINQSSPQINGQSNNREKERPKRCYTVIVDNIEYSCYSYDCNNCDCEGYEQQIKDIDANASQRMPKSFLE